MLKKDGAGGISVLGSVIQDIREAAAKNKRLWLVIGLAVAAVVLIALVVVL